MQAFVSFVGDVPVASEYWQHDRFYGAHFMNGCNPDTIKRCTKLPSNFPVTQELVGNLLDEGDTLEKAIQVLSREPLREFIFNCCAHAYHAVLWKSLTLTYASVPYPIGRLIIAIRRS